MLTIRQASDVDHDAIWNIFREVIAAGETYPLDPKTSREDALNYWFQRDAHVFVAERDGKIAGSYTLHANQSGGGNHVANAAFIVAGRERGQGDWASHGRTLFQRSAATRFSCDAIQLRHFDKPISSQALAGFRNENCGHVAGCVPTSDARICRRLRDVSATVAAVYDRRRSSQSAATIQRMQIPFEIFVVRPICLT